MAWADERDVLIAMTCAPIAARWSRPSTWPFPGDDRDRLSDSPASPIIRAAQHGFIVSVETPQFFPSSVGTLAVLETLLSFVISVATGEIVDRVETFHQRRTDHGFYEEDPS